MSGHRLEFNGMKVKIKGDFVELESSPEDPEGSAVYGITTDNSMCYMVIFPLAKEEAMPTGDVDLLARSIHSYLHENQGLVEIKTGKTAADRDFVYTIVKSSKEGSMGMLYIVTCQVYYEDQVLNMQGVFEEAGTVGLREGRVFAKAMEDGLVTATDMRAWAFDPYDKDYTEGLLANLSEQERFDAVAPAHPLSEARRFLSYLVANN